MVIKAFRPAVLLMLAGLILGACTSLKQAEGPEQKLFSDRIAVLSQLQDWSLSGRMAVKHTDGGGQGSLNWSQSGDTTDIVLSGPLGIGTMNIHWVPEEVVVNGSNLDIEHRYSGEDAATEFLTSQLGWEFPAKSIRYWLLGIPDPAFAYDTTYSDTGELVSITQLDWEVRYSRFTEQEGYLLPAKMEVEKSGLRLRLVVDEWNPADVAAP